MKKNPNGGNIVRFHRQIQLNIGLIICIIILAYIVFHIFSYLTKDNISVYEVKQGTITSDDKYQALALRQEEVVNSDQNGYIYYFGQNKSRVGVRSLIYSVDSDGSIVNLLNKNSTNATDLNSIDLTDMENTISSFANGYKDNSFQKVYTFKSNLSDELLSAYNKQAIQQNQDQINEAISKGTYQSFYASKPGFLLLNTDGYENVSVDNFTSNQLDSSKYSLTNLSLNEKITSGQPIYKLVTSDNWQLIMEVTDDFEKLMKNEGYVEISFDEDHATSWGAISFQKKAGVTYLILSLDDSMERYADYRFLNITLILDQKSGLKIPNSSIVTKTFFAIPKDYFYQGDDSGESGLLVARDHGTNEFITPTIYYETKDAYYIDSEDINAKDYIIKSNSDSTYLVGSKTAKLNGVYNVNKGYAVFKQIEIISSNEDYSIIKSQTDYGLSLYDHIVLQGNMVQENDIIY